MRKVAVIADSIGCIPRDLVETFGIEIVAPNIYWDGSVYRDWLDINPGQAYELLQKDPESFSTAAPSPGDLADTYRKISRTAESLVFITLSSRVSTLHNAALAARGLVKDELPETRIEVLDSRTCTGAEGFVVMAAARAASEGKGLAEIIDEAKSVRDRVDLLFVLDTVRHAYRTGRIPRLASRVGSLLDVKPVMGWWDGAARFKGMTRSKDKGIDQIVGLMRSRVHGKRVHVAVHHADAAEEGEKLKERVRKEFDCVELWLTEFSPIMGYSAGRGALGLAFYAEK
ncbi:MAG: DegV family protein [Dehalococcoidia bacterium]|nr:DegV family protein [Dehalococcoidia bacterium]